MRRTTLQIASLALLILPLTIGHQALAQEAVILKFDPQLQLGSDYQVDVEAKTDQILTIAGTPIETHGNTFLTSSEKVVAARSEGGWKLSGSFTLVQSDLELPGGIKISFNSNNPEAAGAEGPLAMITDALKATAGAKWTSETDDAHNLVKMEYEGDPFGELNPLVKGQSDPESIKKARAIDKQRYPAEPVKPGDTWTRREESDVGGGQTITLEKEYTYVGPEERDGRTFDKVAAKALSVEYKMADDSPSPAKVTDSELEVAASEGTYWYNRAALAFTEVTESVEIKGTLTLEVNGQKLPGELDLTIATTTRSKVVPP